VLTEIAFGQSFFAVPEITCSAVIKLNARVSLLHAANRIGSDHRTVPQTLSGPHRQSRQARALRLAALFDSPRV
jgi:hypothetical protein